MLKQMMKSIINIFSFAQSNEEYMYLPSTTLLSL